MKKVIVVGIDMDNVLAKFDESWLATWRKQFPGEYYVAAEDRRSFLIRDDYPERLREQVDRIYHAPGFYRNLPPVFEGIKAVKELKKLGYDVPVCTSPLPGSDYCLPEKLAWAKEHLGSDFAEKMIVTTDKTLLRFDWLIDDCPVIKGVRKPCWRQIIVDAPYNHWVKDRPRLNANWSNWKYIFGLTSRVIMLDLMFTVIVPKAANRWQQYRFLLNKHAGIVADIVDIERAYKQARKEAEANEPHGESQLPPGYYRNLWGWINARLIALLGYSDKASQEIGEAIYLDVMGNSAYYRVARETRQFLAQARQRRYGLFLATNQEREYAERLLQAFRLRHFFSGLVVSDEVGYKKPSARFFDEAIKNVGLPIENIAFIGNNPRNDMEGAASAGIKHRFLYDPRKEHADAEGAVAYVTLKRLVDVFLDF